MSKKFIYRVALYSILLFKKYFLYLQNTQKYTQITTIKKILGDSGQFWNVDYCIQKKYAIYMVFIQFLELLLSFVYLLRLNVIPS